MLQLRYLQTVGIGVGGERLHGSAQLVDVRSIIVDYFTAYIVFSWCHTRWDLSLIHFLCLQILCIIFWTTQI